MQNMSNQLLGVKPTLDTMASQIAALQSQVAQLQAMMLQVDAEGNFTMPLVEINEEEPQG